jgi:hypothetical protein
MNNSRYPGANPFETHQEHIFFGRNADTAKLHQLIKLEPLVVLYAKSGMGKSSLLNAGIIPAVLQDGDYHPFTVRFQAWTPDKTVMPVTIIRQVLAPNGSDATFLDTLIQDEPNLWHELKELQIKEHKKILLIFDQFEELFTYPQAAIDVFKEELAEVLYTKIPQRYRNVLEQQIEDNTLQLSDEDYGWLQEPIDLHIVMSIRSDRMSFLNALTDCVPTVLKHLFELPPLSIEAAERAILAPAQRQDAVFSTPPFDYSPQAIQKILDFLTQDNNERIESTQLQIICQSAENKVTTAGQVIQDSDLGDLSLVIENYYYDQLKQLGDDAAQLPARRFIEEGLIFEDEQRRLSVFEGQVFKTYHLSPETLTILVNAHLLRAEPSMHGGYTYELSHDTLVAPILKAKNKRLDTEKFELGRLEAIQQAEQLKAEEAAKQKELAEAQKQKDLEEAQRMRKIEHKRTRRSYILLVFSTVGLAIALWQYLVAEKANKRADVEMQNTQTEMQKTQKALDDFNLEKSEKEKSAFEEWERRIDDIFEAGHCPPDEFYLIKEKMKKGYPNDTLIQQIVVKLTKKTKLCSTQSK